MLKCAELLGILQVFVQLARIRLSSWVVVLPNRCLTLKDNGDFRGNVTTVELCSVFATLRIAAITLYCRISNRLNAVRIRCSETTGTIFNLETLPTVRQPFHQAWVYQCNMLLYHRSYVVVYAPENCLGIGMCAQYRFHFSIA